MKHSLHKSVEFAPYNLDPIYYDSHAYGLLFNPHHSPLIIYDIDIPDLSTIRFIIKLLMEHDDVEIIDIARSSIACTGEPKGVHIYAGLKRPFNIISLYQNHIIGSCKGFNDLVIKKNELVIRVSPKFYKGFPDPLTDIQWEVGYTKLGDNKWLRFTSEQLIAPLISADAQFLNEEELDKPRSLRLRG